MWKTPISITTLLIFFCSSCLAETPNETEFKNLIRACVEEEMGEDKPTEKQMQEVFKDALVDFRASAAEWTEDDSAKLKQGKPLIADFEKVKADYEKIAQKGPFNFFLKKSKEQNLSHLQQRVLSDMLRLIQKQNVRSKTTLAINNMKDVYIAVREYAFHHGGKVMGKKGDGMTANQHFNILLEKEIAVQKKPFHLPNIAGFNKVQTDAKLLTRGDNVFAFNPGINIRNDSANAPLLAFPLILKNGKIIADKDALNGEVVVISSDGAGTVYKIGPKGEILKKDGSNLLDPKHKDWDGKEMDFRLPERLEK